MSNTNVRSQTILRRNSELVAQVQGMEYQIQQKEREGQQLRLRSNEIAVALQRAEQEGVQLRVQLQKLENSTKNEVPQEVMLAREALYKARHEMQSKKSIESLSPQFSKQRFSPSRTTALPAVLEESTKL